MADAAAPPTPRVTRDCSECGLKMGLKLQNTGLFTVYYVCIRCGTQLTIPPREPHGL